MTIVTNQPSHLVYHVDAPEGNMPGNWTKLGAMWPHKDGKGWNMQLQFLPVGHDGKLIIRQYEPREKTEAS
ncbi:MAG: hypothetical protein R2867_02800 [Caldilineaceae bacterium]